MIKTVKKIVSILLSAAIFISSAVSFTGISVQAAVTPPTAPGNVKAVSASYNSIKISWSAVSGASGYAVYCYNTSTKGYNCFATTDNTSYVDSFLSMGITYTYKVSAYKTVNGKNTYGKISGAVSAKPMPSVPAGFKAVSASWNSIQLSWKAVEGATGYSVNRYNTDTKRDDCLTETGSTSFLDESLMTGKTYTYKVRAYRTVNGKKTYGNLSGAVSAKPVPAAPGSFKIVSATSNSIKTSWKAPAGATGYELYRSVNSTAGFALIKSLTATSYSDNTLVSNKTYYYKLRAYRTVKGTKYYGSFTAAISKPATVADILVAYTAVMNKAKASKPTYMKREFQAIPESSPLLSALLPLAGYFLTTEDEASTEYFRDGNMNWFPVGNSSKGCMLTDTSAIKSAACVPLDTGNYKITIILNDEHNAEPYKKGQLKAASNTGNMFNPISTEDIDDTLQNDSKVKKIVSDVQYDLKYYDCTAVLEYNPATNQVATLDQYMNIFVDIQACKIFGISATGNAVLTVTMKTWGFHY